MQFEDAKESINGADLSFTDGSLIFIDENGMELIVSFWEVKGTGSNKTDINRDEKQISHYVSQARGEGRIVLVVYSDITLKTFCDPEGVARKVENLKSQFSKTQKQHLRLYTVSQLIKRYLDSKGKCFQFRLS